MKKNIISSFMIITVFNALDRALGFLFRIYLSREMGAESMGVYQVASSVFMALLTFITIGIPLVVSKSTAKAERNGQTHRLSSISTAALCIGLTTGAAAVAATFALRPLLSSLMGERAVASLLMLVPSLLFSAIYSAFRGNLWGRSKFFVVALVEVIEQAARMSCCFILFSQGADKLLSSSFSLTAGCAISAAACAVFYFRSGGKLRSPKNEWKALLKSELPITLSRAAATLASSVLSVAAPMLFVLSGYSSERAYELFGAASGMALPLLYVPLTVIGSLAFVLIPSIGACADEGRYESVNRSISSAVNFSAIVACLFIPLFSVCGEAIGGIVYGNADSGRFLSAAAWILLPLSIESITSSLMNSLDLEMRSFINSMIGYACQALTYVIFARGFTPEIFALGIGVSLTVSTGLHIYYIYKKTGLRLKTMKNAAMAALMIFPAATLNRSLFGIFSFAPPLAAVVMSGLITMAAYILLCFAFGWVEMYPILKRGKKARAKAG